MTRFRSSRCSTLVLAAGLISLPFHDAAQAQTNLASQYKGKTLILRGFYPGHRLKYDSSGDPINPSAPDDWTVAGVVKIKDLHVSGGHLRIDARRIYLQSMEDVFQELRDHDKEGQLVEPEKQDRSLRIEADLGSASPDVVLLRIFLNDRDSFAALVPTPWKPCVSGALKSEKPAKGILSPSCHFSADFLAIPGVANPDLAGDSKVVASENTPIDLSRMVQGVTPPRALQQINPDFSEESRMAHYSGTVVLALTVDENGRSSNVRIIRPLGAGLDARAVRSVERWNFQPATKDGQPVAVEIAIEVDFHLY